MQTYVKMVWRVYGAAGHRQKESFNPSYNYDFSEGENIRKIEVQNSDKTGSNDYTKIIITRNTRSDCIAELWGQVYDGIFENCKVGKIIEVEV